MNTCPNCGMVKGLHASILPGCMCPTTPQDTFTPDWNTQVVLVEEMQRMAKRIEELEALAQSESINMENFVGSGKPVVLAQPEQSTDDPVAWMYDGGNKAKMYAEALDDSTGWTPLYASPPQRQPLTDGEIYTAYITATDQTLRPQDERLAFAFARAIEAAHGIGDKT